MFINIFRLICAELRIRWLKLIAMTSDRLSFAQVEIDKSYLLTLLRGQVTSRNQGFLSTKRRDTGRPRRESVGTKLGDNDSECKDDVTVVT